ncbi:nitroreductase family protein [Peptoniphilus catoniae]|uniref:nitroreductase family protein n=1 Tax=Peptoniphilus catoniae TaxID=1660341 RepID=UPI0010FEEA0F|nr:nitroreductase family protein [Peptoniphilus catoniae]
MFYELAKRRRSYRKFSNEEIDEDKLKKILASGLLAPTGANSKKIEFVVLKNQKDIEVASELKPMGSAFLKEAKVAIIVCCDKSAPTYRQDASIAAAYLQLAVEDEGLGSCWANVIGARYNDTKTSEDYLKDKFFIPESFHIECVIGLGGKIKEADEKAPDFSKIHYNRF